MSGGGWKEPFYKIAAQDSRNMADLGNKLGWDFLEEEGNRNTENPGRAITKAAEYALAGYLGGLYGGAEAAAAEGAVGAGTGAAASGTVDWAAQQAAVQAAEQAAAGAQSSVYSPTIWDKLASGSSSTGGGKQLAMQMGMQSMKPQEPQPMGAPPPRQQGNMEPLPSPYGQQGTNGLLSLEEIERKRKMGLLR